MKITPKHLIQSIIFLILLGCSFFLLLPFLCTTFILPQLLEKLAIPHKEVQIVQLTHHNLSGSIHFAGNNQDLLTVPRFTLHYSLQDLLKGQLHSLEIEGGSLEASLINGKIVFDGIPSQTEGTSKLATPNLLLPITLQSLILKNCSLVVNNTPSEKVHFIFDGLFRPEIEKVDSGYLLSGAEGDINVSGTTPLHLSFSTEKKEGGYKITGTGKIPAISKLVEPYTRLGQIQGKAEFSLETFFYTAPVQPGNFTVSISITDFVFRHQHISLLNNSSKDPVTIKIQGSNQSAEYIVEGLSISHPQKAAIHLKGMINKSSQMIHTAGTMQLESSNFKNANLLTSYSTEFYPPEQRFKAMFQLQDEDVNNFRMAYKGTTFNTAPIQISIHGTQEKNNSSFDIALHTKNIRIEKNGESSQIPTLQILANFHEKEAGKTIEITGNIPEIAFPERDINLRNMSFLFPISLPISQGTEDNGSLDIKNIQGFGTDIASLTLKSQIGEQGLQFAGTVDNQLMKPMQIRFSGHLDSRMNLEIDYALPPSHFSSTLLPAALPFPDLLTVEAEIELQGNFSYKKQIPQGTLSARLSQGSISMDNINLNITGISTDIRLPQLPKIDSEPSQKLIIESIDYGTLRFSEGRIHYQLEDQANLFIEKSSFSWCSGKIESGSLRLSSEHPEIETMLYCDRLSLSELLTQFSISDTEGEGSLNGKLPVHLSKSGLDVDGGFLFSTPGKSGIIKFNNTEILRNSLPAVDKTGYLDYSLQALEDFSYNWTRLTFSKREENLLLAMEIDGKPTLPLPFSFKKGQMKPNGKGTGMQHPVRLDVNFLLPLNDMFKYGQNIQSIMENM